MQRREPDPLGRTMALLIAAGRLLLGVWIFADTRGALARLGFERPRDETLALARLAAGRDVALGLHGLAAADDRDRLRESVAIGIAVDAGDAVAFGMALGGGDRVARTAALNAPLGAAAAAVGAWVLKRL